MPSQRLPSLLPHAAPGALLRFTRHVGAVLAGLCVAGSGCAQGSTTGAETASAGQAFAAAFRQAAARGDAAALADHTVLPFLYEGRLVGRATFMAEVVPALFTPAVRRCLASPRTRNVAEDGRLVLWCAPYGFYLGADARGRWHLEEFAADGGQ